MEGCPQSEALDVVCTPDKRYDEGTIPMQMGSKSKELEAHVMSKLVDDVLARSSQNTTAVCKPVEENIGLHLLHRFDEESVLFSEEKGRLFQYRWISCFP
jgi:hypothetical protein